MENNTTPTEPAPSAPTPDRSKIQSVYPALASDRPPVPEAQPATSADKYETANAAFIDASVIIAGGLSATLFPVIGYFSKSTYVAGGISILLALVAMVLAVRNYRAGRSLTPLVVIGLSAATFTMLYAAIILITNALVRSISYY